MLLSYCLEASELLLVKHVLSDFVTLKCLESYMINEIHTVFYSCTDSSIVSSSTCHPIQSTALICQIKIYSINPLNTSNEERILQIKPSHTIAGAYHKCDFLLNQMLTRLSQSSSHMEGMSLKSCKKKPNTEISISLVCGYKQVITQQNPLQISKESVTATLREQTSQ